MVTTTYRFLPTKENPEQKSNEDDNNGDQDTNSEIGLRLCLPNQVLPKRIPSKSIKTLHQKGHTSLTLSKYAEKKKLGEN